jgi:hypothetical protein
MPTPLRWLNVFVVTTLFFGAAGKAAAERIRYHFVPGSEGCLMQLQPGPNGAAGERVRYCGKPNEPVAHAPRPTCSKTYRHPCTGQEITVPLSLPWGTPRVEHVYRRVVYNYGSYTVAVLFLPDGSVDVIYNSGLLRGLCFGPDGTARVFYNGPPFHKR